MKVILSQDIANLGEEGDVKEVANGFARNFLLPKKLVIAFTQQNLARLEKNKAAIESRREEKRKIASGLKEKLEAEQIVIEVPAGDSGKLFGSVNNATIFDILSKRGYSIEKKRIEVPSHNIKMIGDYKIRIKLYGHQEAVIQITIKASAEKK